MTQPLPQDNTLSFPLSRRALLAGSLALLVPDALALAADRSATRPTTQQQPEVTPTEDLMREHGVLRRLLLAYEESARRIEANQPLPAKALVQTSDLIRRFIEDYHERLEEQYLFPRFRQANQQVDLVNVLLQQHEAGRRLTAQIVQLSTNVNLNDLVQRQRTSQLIRQFMRMYRPHAAREDTVLFPALHQLYTDRQYDQLGDEFENKERQLFGVNGFETIVSQVEQLEKNLGIYDLAQFTPPATAPAR